MAFIDELKLHLDARIAVLNLVTPEEPRLLRELTAWARGRHCPEGEGLYTWDIADQFTCLKRAAAPFDVKQQATPDTILRMIRDYQGQATFVLKDFHQVWEAKRGVIRGLRNLVATLPSSAPRKNLLITTPEPNLPTELKQDIPVLELAKPDAQEIDALLEHSLGGTGALDRLAGPVRDKLVRAALGLGSTQAERVFRKAVVSRPTGLDETCIDLITDEKRAIIRESGALELYPHLESESRLGGLDALKEWLGKRVRAFTEEARRFPLDEPKGVALVGIPGTGKSLCAKVAAGMWRMPLLRLDMGAVFGGLLGSSERNIREAMQIAEVIAPCVLWVDEIEKAFGASSDTASRVLATFLTWMQEKQHPVFVFATANDVSRLPPEFLRKGRFDELFFLDLPTRLEREQILEVHLRRRGMTMVRDDFDLPAVAKATEGFVGAELEAMVNEAMFAPFLDGERQLETEDLLKAAGAMVPLAQSHRERIEALRQLVTSGQARNASSARADDAVRVDDIRGERRLEMY